jgi:hypothetical protein
MNTHLIKSTQPNHFDESQDDVTYYYKGTIAFLFIQEFLGKHMSKIVYRLLHYNFAGILLIQVPLISYWLDGNCIAHEFLQRALTVVKGGVCARETNSA